MTAPQAKRPANTSAPPFSVFWSAKNTDYHPLVDKLIANNLSVFLAFACSRLGMTANFLTVLRGFLAVLAFCFSLFLPVDRPSLSILCIFALSYFIFLLDCADGQLARATNTESRFGKFLDLCVDIISLPLFLGTFFCFSFRYFDNLQDSAYMIISFFVGFVFIVTKIAKFFTWVLFYNFLKTASAEKHRTNNTLITILSNLSDTQFSIFGFLLFPVSPALTFLFFACQSVVATASFLRFIWRAHRLR